LFWSFCSSFLGWSSFLGVSAGVGVAFGVGVGSTLGVLLGFGLDELCLMAAAADEMGASETVDV
jgi:Na+-transporting NADH:ubiquinone oxidoreductase subunit NqrE